MEYRRIAFILFRHLNLDARNPLLDCYYGLTRLGLLPRGYSEFLQAALPMIAGIRRLYITNVIIQSANLFGNVTYCINNFSSCYLSVNIALA